MYTVTISNTESSYSATTSKTEPTLELALEFALMAHLFNGDPLDVLEVSVIEVLEKVKWSISGVGYVSGL